MSMDVNRTPKKMEGPGEDFRPPWVYIGSRLISFLVIPSTSAAPPETVSGLLKG
ncbi:hypothetical protein CPB84DRAFT_1766541, partial [Gymnopilus junonius]